MKIGINKEKSTKYYCIRSTHPNVNNESKVKASITISIFALFFVLNTWLCSSLFAQNTKWKLVTGHIITRWAKYVNPNNALAKYPRPQMVRKQWMNLNGLWQYDTVNTKVIPFNKTLSGQSLSRFQLNPLFHG